MIASIVVNVPLYVRQNRYVPDMAKLAVRLTKKDYDEMDQFFDRKLMQLLGMSSGMGRSA